MTKHAPKRRRARALLVASSGLAATLLVCGCDDLPFGNPGPDLGGISVPHDLSVEDLSPVTDGSQSD